MHFRFAREIVAIGIGFVYRCTSALVSCAEEKNLLCTQESSQLLPFGFCTYFVFVSFSFVRLAQYNFEMLLHLLVR